MFRWRYVPTVVLSPLAELGIGDEHAEEFNDAVASNSDWPDVAMAPAVSADTWPAARSAIDGKVLRPRALQPATEWLRPISDAVEELGVRLKIVETARLVQFGAAPTSGYLVFARRAANGVCFTLSWSPPLSAPVSP
jgi:hypothetical protein